MKPYKVNKGDIVDINFRIIVLITVFDMVMDDIHSKQDAIDTVYNELVTYKQPDGSPLYTSVDKGFITRVIDKIWK